ncbi:MAG: TolC family protein [Chitinophagaceae bacterium]|nr:TolC family protein [Chitinophagaceae bacterium]
MEVSAGLEYLSGNRTDPVETKGQTSYLGVSVPLAKNLLMDKRRAALQTAKIFRDASAIEKRNMLNNLMLDAMAGYWNWVKQYQVYKILTEALTVNEKRVELIKTAFRLGDRPAIDTIEALTQLQNIELMKNQAWLDFQNTGLELSVFLWLANATPFNMSIDIVPGDDLQLSNIATEQLPDLNNLLESAIKIIPNWLSIIIKLMC